MSIFGGDVTVGITRFKMRADLVRYISNMYVAQYVIASMDNEYVLLYTALPCLRSQAIHHRPYELHHTVYTLLRLST